MASELYLRALRFAGDANSRFTGHPIDVEFTKEALKDLLSLQAKLVTIENMQYAPDLCDGCEGASMHSSRHFFVKRVEVDQIPTF